MKIAIYNEQCTPAGREVHGWDGVEECADWSIYEGSEADLLESAQVHLRNDSSNIYRLRSATTLAEAAGGRVIWHGGRGVYKAYSEHDAQDVLRRMDRDEVERILEAHDGSAPEDYGSDLDMLEALVGADYELVETYALS